MTALDVALAYHQAWTGHDFEAAMQYVADGIFCQAPSGPIEGAEAFRGFMEPFSKILLESELLAAYGDESTALLMYGTRTVPVADAPAAELITVADGRITQLRIIFDRQPFTEARAADAS
ncbi:nuclear transport factor 2 family protein [Kribbella sp. NPDC051770]|uniref:nuclear transport factor 2 family protein n=1 Tax=Kribbella sp. NPDC051770 TaxID=3155413 RepID=UPI003448D9E1